MPATYLQVFSMTDHAAAFDRYQGPYVGINADLATSEWKEGKLCLSTKTQMPRGELSRDDFENSKLVLAYRHSDTGELRGTSEMLLPVPKAPWNDLPGFEILAVSNERVAVKLWNQSFTIEAGRHTRIHFMKTIVHLKFFGEASEMVWENDELKTGPAHLHALEVDENLTIAPPSGSGLQVKMGQETTQ